MTNLILSTDSTSIAIIKINNRLTGGTYDNSGTTWQIYSGNNLTKRDYFHPNIIINTGNTNNLLISGGANSGLTNGVYSTIFAGTGNTIDYFNNNITSGQDNSISNISNYISGITLFSPNVILAGSGNSISGNFILPINSSILNGQNNEIKVSNISFSKSYELNSILNGLKNKINGIGISNSIVLNGTGNTIFSTNSSFSSVFNGYNNNINSTSNNYNSIIGGYNNNITGQSNCILIGSNITAEINDTTHVNKMFYDKLIMFNKVTLLKTDGINSGLFNYGGVFNPNLTSIGVIQLISSISSLNCDTIFGIQNGLYSGQTIYLIGIPTSRTSDASPFFTGTRNIILTGNIISTLTSYALHPAGITLNNTNLGGIIGGSNVSPADAPGYAGLGIFVWDGAYWIRADYNGGV